MKLTVNVKASVTAGDGKLDTIGILNDLDHYCDVVDELETLVDTYNNIKETDISTDSVTLEILEIEEDTTKDVDNVAGTALINYLKDDIYMLEGTEAAKYIDALLDRIEELESWEMSVILLCLEEGIGDYDPIKGEVMGVDYLDDIQIYYFESYKELAEHFVDEGLYGDIPEAIKYHIDYESIGRELQHEYSETELLGENVIYRLP